MMYVAVVHCIPILMSRIMFHIRFFTLSFVQNSYFISFVYSMSVNSFIANVIVYLKNRRLNKCFILILYSMSSASDAHLLAGVTPPAGVAPLFASDQIW